MRITKKQLVKSNERKNVVIFIITVICFVLSITVSVQYQRNKNVLQKQASKFDCAVNNTNEIIGILTIGGQEWKFTKK